MDRILFTWAPAPQMATFPPLPAICLYRFSSTPMPEESINSVLEKSKITLLM